MKKTGKMLSALLLAMSLTMGMSTAAFAEGNPTVTFNNDNVAFNGVTDERSPDSDLFPEFKNVMPGDVTEQTITVENRYKRSDYLKVYMYVEPHSEENIPVSQVDMVEMEKFLDQLTLTVWDSDGREIFNDKASSQGGLDIDHPALIGRVNKNRSKDFKVQLNVPTSLEMKQAVGEIDWVFYAVPGNNKNVDPDDGPQYHEKIRVKKVWEDGGKGHPDKVVMQLYDGDKLKDTVSLSEDNNWRYTWRNLSDEGDWKVVEKDVKGFKASYDKSGYEITVTNTSTGDLIQTGQLNWPIPVLLTLGAALVILGGAAIWKKKKQNSAK